MSKDQSDPLERFNQLVAKARHTNDERDTVEGKHGFANPVNCPVPVGVQTVLFAFQAGMARSDWDCIAEGYVILDDITKELFRIAEIVGRHYECIENEKRAELEHRVSLEPLIRKNWKAIMAKPPDLGGKVACKYCHQKTLLSIHPDGSIVICSRCGAGLAPMDDVLEFGSYRAWLEHLHQWFHDKYGEGKTDGQTG
jgi:hypothetical protein